MQRNQSLFENAIHCEATMKLYSTGLKKFMQFVGYDNRLDKFASLDFKIIDKHLEDYVMFNALIVMGNFRESYALEKDWH